MRINRIISLALCALLALSMFSFPAAADDTVSGSVDFMTYNVSGVPILGDTHSSQRKFIGSGRMRAIADVLSKEDADLVAVEEDFTFNRALAGAMEDTYPNHTWSDAGLFGSDGLNAFSKFPIYNVERVRWNVMYGVLSGACDRLAEKGILYFVMELAPGAYVDCYVIHADCGHGVDYKSIYTRRDNFIQLREMIAEKSEGRAVVVLGDFNSRYDREEDDDLYGTFVQPAGLKDAWAELENGGNYIYNEETWSPTLEESLDKVMYRSGGGVELNAESVRHYDIEDENGASYSDHRSTRVTLSYTVSGAAGYPGTLTAPEEPSILRVIVKETIGFFRALILALTHLYEIPYPYELYQKITGKRL